MMREAMLESHINNLQASIQWAQYQDDIDVLNMARTTMDELVHFITTLPESQQQDAYLHIDNVLPMEWPIWMEACRYNDSEPVAAQPVVLH
jgi:hypothetical protein